MAIDLSTLYENAAVKYLREAGQRAEDAGTKREQMKVAPHAWGLVLLTEAIILDKEAAYLQGLAQSLQADAATTREPL